MQSLGPPDTHFLSAAVGWCELGSVAEAKVELSGDGHQIHLRISDQGKGIDPGSAAGQTGLGLISMRERLRLVGGHLVIESEPSHGTRIRVRVPLPTTNAGVASEEKAQEAGA